MRLVQVASRSAGIGGVETYVRSLTAWMVRQGVECTVLSGDGGAVAGATVERVKPLARSQLTKASAEAVCDHLLRYGADVALVHLNGGAEMFDALANAGVGTAVFVHTFACPTAKLFRTHETVCTHQVGMRCLWDWFAGPCGTSANPLAAWRGIRQAGAYLSRLGQVDAVFVATEFMRRYLEGEGVPSSSISVERWSPSSTAAGEDAQDRAPANLQHAPSPRTVLFVGRLVLGKGVHHLVDAMTVLGDGYVLRVVGDGWYRPALEDQVRRLRINDRVVLTGARSGPALQAEIAAADVVAVPSILPEPWGLVVGEAAAAGKPVIVSDVGGLPEWRERVPGVVVCRAGSARALATAIEEICTGSLPAVPVVKAKVTETDGPAVLLERLQHVADAASLSGRP